MNNTLSPQERLRRAQIAVTKDFELFAKTCLRVVDKEGNLVPFVMNAQQRVLHAAAEHQLATKGFVRMIVPKSRRAGISTYVAARFYWKTATQKHRKTLIFSHEQSSSDGLYEIVERYHANNPFAPFTGKSNAKELVFDGLDSSYIVATAGATDFGRGLGFFYFHGSEVSRWPNAKKHFEGVVQTVPDKKGTEIFLESTGAGPVGEFYEKTMKAIHKEGDYDVCFLPWMLDADNFREPPEDFVLNEEKAPGADMSEAEYARLFGLTPGQAYWARIKRTTLHDENAFRREFPACVQDVFAASEAGQFHDATHILRARKEADRIGAGPLIFGVDPAGMGGDRFVVAARRGHVVEWVESRTKVEGEEGALWLKTLIDEHKPTRVFIDAGGLGAPIISRVRGMGPEYAKIIRAVNFGSKSQFKKTWPKKPGPVNVRAEIQQRLKDWLADADLQKAIPDDDALQADMLSIRRKPDNNNDLRLVSKDEMKEKGYRSPDLADGVALTFTATVYDPAAVNQTTKLKKASLSEHIVSAKEGGSWMSG